LNLLFASHNVHKTKELQRLLPADWTLQNLYDLQFYDPIDETGNNLEENALLKCRFLYQKLQIPCFAEDTGLEVNSLNMAPGVHTARFAGATNEPALNIKKLLDLMADEVQRDARFRTVIAYKDKDQEVLFEGMLEGNISYYQQGDQGFGYDPIFIPKGYEKTLAELGDEVKSQISHRSLAMAKFIVFLHRSLK
jgi:XTP/dITP diphosphohydrolase